MIGDRFLRYLNDTQPRYMSRLNLLVNYLNQKIQDNTRRANHLTPNGYGSRLLIDIIKLADLEKLLAPGDPFRWGGINLLSMLKDLEKMIDVRAGKHTTDILFIKSRTPCFELMTPSRRSNPLLEIPTSLPYSDPAWSTIKPLRISDMGPCDLKFNFQTDYLHYHHRGPTHAVYALDCYALVTKFVAYYKSKQQPVSDLDQCLLDYVHDEVIVPAIMNDMLAIWLRNIYRQQLISYSPLESYTATMWDAITTDSIGSVFTTAMEDVTHLKNDLRQQSITAQTALSSFLVTTDKKSFSKYYMELFNTTTTPDQQPYVWVDCIKNIPWWEFILLVTSFLPAQPDTISLRRDVARDVRFWIAMKPWQEIRGSIPFREMVRNKLEGMYAYLKAA